MPKSDSRYDAGLAVRKEVLGGEYVERALSSVDDFSQALQDHLNEFCWGLAWTRPGLDRRTRSLLTLGVLATLGKPNEIKTHTLGALRNGCTVTEIQEVFLHVAVYAGVPAAVDAFRSAAPVVAERATA